MKIAILGAGFTGLTAALRLVQKGHTVSVFEKENYLGGLAVGFREKNWEWSLEKAYHHWFTNDTAALTLAKELSYPVITKRPSTDVYVHEKRVPLDSPLSLLAFPYLSIQDRLRTGFAALYLKTTNDYKRFEGNRATVWIRKWMGEQSYRTIWEPLFQGKFWDYKDDVSLIWFWARIKKRTPSLAYPKGGFADFANRIAEEIKKYGGEIHLNTEVESIKKEKGKIKIKNETFDKGIITLPTPVFLKLAGKLPTEYVKKISSIEYLHALTLILILDKPFMKKTYWLNVTDTSFPFLVLVEHTNFMNPKYYGNQHLVYIGNYLPKGHRYFKMRKEDLLKEFTPYLRKINPNFESSVLSSQLFIGPFAQPIVTTDYEKKIPSMETPTQNIFLANLSMVYPWDRGTNYAIELGEKVANVVGK